MFHTITFQSIDKWIADSEFPLTFTISPSVALFPSRLLDRSAIKDEKKRICTKDEKNDEYKNWAYNANTN